MECFVCHNLADSRESEGDYIDLFCPEGGDYRASGAGVRLFERGRWLNTIAMQLWLEDQRRDGTKLPMIGCHVVAWDGVWVQGYIASSTGIIYVMGGPAIEVVNW